MDIAITGATGFLGTALRRRLEADGHSIRIISRRPGGLNTIHWDPDAGRLDGAALEGVEAVVHLAGEGIASRPWSDAQRARLRSSRITGTRLLVDTLERLDRKPDVLVSASGIGFYGDRGDEVLDESSASGNDFLADLCVDWEAEAMRAADAGIRTATIRTGIVLDAEEGALAKQLLPFRLGLGARAGSGRQWLSWISVRDHVSAIAHLLQADVSGPVNLTAPNPVRNQEFTKAVAEELHRPQFLVIPRLVAKAPFGVGPLVESLLFMSQRVQPEVLTASGFTFQDPELDQALAHVLHR